MSANIPPWIIVLIVRLSAHVLSQREILRNTGVSRGGISKVIHHFRETRRAIERPHGHRLRMTTPREDRSLVWIMRRNRFLSSLRIRVELIRRTGRHVFAGTVQRYLVAVGYYSRRPAKCPRLTHNHRCRRRMGKQAPEMEPSALVVCDIWWWVQIQPLPLWWPCPSSSARWWETSASQNRMEMATLLRENHHALVVWNWYHWVAIAY